MCPFADFVHQIYGCLGISEVGYARFHSNSYSSTHFDGIHSVVVVQTVQHSYGIEIINAAVPTMCPHRLIFGLLGEVLAIFVQVSSRALDDTSAVTTVSG